MQIDKNTLDRLIALGRAKGQLTNQDLEEALPVETMSPDDIALLVVHLEDAGIAVELDESLLTGQSGRPLGEIRKIDFIAPEPPAERASPVRTDLSPGNRPGLDDAGVPAHGNGAGPSVHRAVALAGLAVVALLALAFVLTRA